MIWGKKKIRKKKAKDKIPVKSIVPRAPYDVTELICAF